MRLVHIIDKRPGFEDEIIVLLDDDALDPPEDFCPLGYEVHSVTEIEGAAGLRLPGDLPTDRALRPS